MYTQFDVVKFLGLIILHTSRDSYVDVTHAYTHAHAHTHSRHLTPTSFQTGSNSVHTYVLMKLFFIMLQLTGPLLIVILIFITILPARVLHDQREEDGQYDDLRHQMHTVMRLPVEGQYD
jgi:hypothetical protein